MLGNPLRAKMAIPFLTTICLAVLTCALLAFNARAQDRLSLIGSWYGDLAKTEAIDGRSVNHRRWLRILRADGTYTIIFRFYFDNRLQEERIEHGEWGHQGRRYWTQCRSATKAGGPVPCSARWEYHIHRLDQREMAYTNTANGAFFVVTRVAGDYRLP